MLALPEEGARDVHLLAPHDTNFVAIEGSLRHNGSQAAHEMLTSIDNDRLQVK